MYFPLFSEWMAAAKFSMWHNYWSNVYDFTPAAGNFTLLPQTAKVTTLLEPPVEVLEILGNVSSAVDDKQVPLISTWGERPPTTDGYVFVLFPTAQIDKAFEFLQQASDKATLLRTNETRIPPEIAKQMATISDWGRIEKTLSTGRACIGMEFAGAACRSTVPDLADKMGALTTFDENVGTMFRELGLD